MAIPNTEIINNGENGFLHEPNDLSGFLSSIESLANDRIEYYRISTNALNFSKTYKLMCSISIYSTAYMAYTNGVAVSLSAGHNFSCAVTVLFTPHTCA